MHMIFKKMFIILIILLLSLTSIISTTNCSGEILGDNNLSNNFYDNKFHYDGVVSSENSIASNYNGFELDQYQDSDGNIGFIIGYYVLAQSFKPSMTPLVKVDLYGFDNVSNSPIDVSIRENLFGDDLTKITVNSDEIPTDYAWFECDFPDIEVELDKTYFIVINQNGDGKFILRGHYGIDYYSRGNGFSRQENTQDWVNLTIVFPNFDYCFKTYSYGDNLPPNSPVITGPKKCGLGIPNNYTFSSYDPDGDKVLFKVDWGDETITEWIGPIKSGQELLLNHTWSVKSSYTIKVQSKDIYGDKSEWISLNIRVSTEKNKIFDLFINKLLRYFFYLFN